MLRYNSRGRGWRGHGVFCFGRILFNNLISGIILIYSIPRIRYIPVQLAEGLAQVALGRKWLALAYTLGAFVLVPIIGIVVLR